MKLELTQHEMIAVSMDDLRQSVDHHQRQIGYLREDMVDLQLECALIGHVWDPDMPEQCSVCDYITYGRLF